MLKDLRHGVRSLLREIAWTAVVVLSLAIGIGANAALFGAIDGMFLQKLPVRDPDSLVRFKYAGRNEMVTDSSDYGFSKPDSSGLDVRSTFSYPMFRQFVANNRTMTDLFACAPIGRVNLSVDGRAEIANGFVSSGNYYRVLGLTANPGRTLLPDDDGPTAAPAAVISTPYWRSRFGGDPAAVGKVVRVNNVPVTIVGVIATPFSDVQHGVGEPPDIAVPLALADQLANAPAAPGEPNVPLLERPTYWWLQIMGRLKPGSTAAQVQGNLEGVFQHTARAGLDAFLAAVSPEVRSTARNRNRREVPRLRVEPGGRGIYDVNTSDATAVAIVSAVVALILLIVCANVANLLLSRAATRQREISIRLSLGATRARLVRQLLTESLLLASLGGALGAFVGRWGQQLLPGRAGQLPPFDWRTFAFLVVVTGGTGILFGIAPAVRAAGTNVSAALKENSRAIAGSRSLLAKSLLVLQVAVSLVLLVGAGLFLRTVQNLRSVEVGFKTDNLVVFRINPSLNGYDDVRTRGLYGQLLDRIRRVGGVTGVALSNHPLLSGSINTTTVFVDGRATAPDQRTSIHRLVVSPDFFATMQIPLVVGRGFTERDNQTAQKVGVINQAAVRKLFPDENPIGRHIGSTVETAGQIEIVGVLRDVKYNSLREPAPPTIYVPYLQNRTPQAAFEVRTAGDPMSAVGALREAVRTVDPGLPLINVTTQADNVEGRLQQERTFAEAYTLFGGIALLVASVGLFGLMSYNVARRTNEIGVRMALGAERGDVVRMVMRDSLALVASGAAIGLAAAAAAGRLVSSLLFGLAPTDPTTILVAVGALAAVSSLAGYVPARRAARVDPLVALRCE